MTTQPDNKTELFKQIEAREKALMAEFKHLKRYSVRCARVQKILNAEFGAANVSAFFDSWFETDAE